MGILNKIISKFSKGPAIQNLENFDMVVEMKDGGVLLPIVVSKHLDDSEEVLGLLRVKVKNYVEMIELEEFKKDFPNKTYFCIELNCIAKPHKNVLLELENFKNIYMNNGIEFAWKK